MRLFATLRLCTTVCLIALCATTGKPKDYDAKALGLWLDNTSDQARAHNDQQLAAFLFDRQPAATRLRTPVVQPGDRLLVDGRLATHQTIEFPTRVGLGGGDNQLIPRPMSFALEGRGPGAWIDCDGAGPAVKVVDNWPLAPLAEYNHVDQLLANLSIKCPRGLGVDIYGGGKFLRVRDVRLVDCREPAIVRYYDGGLLDMHAHRCRTGPLLEACHMCQLRITGREIGDEQLARYGQAVEGPPPANEGVGLVMRNCTGNDCWLYLEAVRLAADIDGAAENNFHLWTEYVGGLHSVHAWMLRLRNCQVNAWTGKTGYENGTPWDCDTVSWAMQKIIGQQPSVGDVIAASLPPGPSPDGRGETPLIRPQVWGKFPQPVTVDAAGWVSVAPGALAGGQSGYVALVYPGEQQQTFEAGDVVQCEFTVEPTASTLAHWRDCLDKGDGRVPLRLSFANDLGAYWANSFFVHRPRQRVSFTRIAPVSGKRILPMVSLGLGYTAGPDERLQFRISDVVVRRLSQPKAASATPAEPTE